MTADGVIAAGSYNIIAAGSGNLDVRQAGDHIIAAGAYNIIAAGSGNLTGGVPGFTASLPGLPPGGFDASVVIGGASLRAGRWPPAPAALAR